MTAVRPATTTVAFVYTYCAAYRDLFADVRSFDHFTCVHLGATIFGSSGSQGSYWGRARSTRCEPTSRTWDAME